MRTGTLDPNPAAHAIETVERTGRWQTQSDGRGHGSRFTVTLPRAA